MERHRETEREGDRERGMIYRRAGSPDQRHEEGGQRRYERRTRWVDVKIVHHAVISWHFVCFDVATAAAASAAG